MKQKPDNLPEAARWPFPVAAPRLDAQRLARTNPYLSAEETAALIKPDTRTKHERELDARIERAGGLEMGADTAEILRRIALELLAEADAK